MINLLISMLGAVLGAWFLVSVLHGKVVRRDFPWRASFSSMDGFRRALEELGDRLKDYFLLVNESTCQLAKIFLGCLVGFVLFTKFGWHTLGSICLSIMAACGIAFWILVHPLVLAVEGMAKLAAPVADFVRREIQRFLQLLFWMFVPVFLYAMLPRNAPPSAVFAVVGISALLVVGALAGLFPLPLPLRLGVVRWKLNFLLVANLLALYVPNLTDYAHWIITRGIASIAPESRRLTAEEIIAISEWFFQSGEPKYFAYRDEGGKYIVYSGPGNSRETGDKLEPVAAVSLVSMIKKQAADESAWTAKEKAARDAEQQHLEAERQKLEDEKQQKTKKEQQDHAAVEQATMEEQQRMQAAEEARLERERMSARYIPSATANTPERTEVAVAINPNVASNDLLDRAVQPAFEALNSPQTIFLTSALNPETFVQDGVFSRVWNGDFHDILPLRFDRCFDYLILVKISEVSGTSAIQNDLRALKCNLTMKIYSTNPVAFLGSLNVSSAAPGFSRDAMLTGSEERLTEELAKKIPQVLVPAKAH